MGDRGNIVVRSSQSNRDDVWFYTHWSGSEVKEIAARALGKRWRWDDASYLARIVFDELTAGSVGEETGFGISSSIGDNEHPIVVIDADKQRVFTVPQKELSDGRIPDNYEPSGPETYWTFDEFIVRKIKSAE